MKQNKYICFILICMIGFALGFNLLGCSYSQQPANTNSNLEQMIGEMIIVGFRGTEVDSSSKIVQDINQYHIGGIILFDYDVPTKSTPRNIVSPKQTKSLIDDLKSLTRQDLLIAIDVEGGAVNRLKPKYGFAEIESAQEMGEDDPENTFTKASLIGFQLDCIGVNVNFAPVVDVNINQDNPIIGQLQRSFSKDPLTVYEHAGYFLEAMDAYGIIGAVKHFPGHGSSAEDSHLGLVDVTHTYDRQAELLPYQLLIQDQKVDMVMTAHIMNTHMDPEHPATLSARFLQDILRKELHYEGVIVSDDMHMGAIVEHYGFEEAIIMAVRAGCDLLIFSNNSPVYDEDVGQKAAEAIKQAVADQKIEQETIQSAYQRIRKLKTKYDIQ